MVRRTRGDFIAAALAGLSGAMFLLAPTFGRGGLWPMHFEAIWILVAVMLGPALASLMFSYDLGRRRGWLGLMADLTLFLFAVVTGILLAGTLVSPVIGTFFAPVFVWDLIKEMPALLLIFVIYIVAALILSCSRRRRWGAGVRSCAGRGVRAATASLSTRPASVQGR